MRARLYGSLGAAFFVAAALFAVPATAAVDVVTLDGAGAVGSADNALAVGDGIITFGHQADGSLTQQLNFATQDAGTVVVSATANTLQSFFDISGLSYEAFDASTNTSLGSAAASSVLSFAASAGQAFYVVFSGNVTGSLGGNYTGNVALTPIPGALLLLGPALAGLGFVGYRRKQATA
jgi:hypothetical protein